MSWGPHWNSAGSDPPRGTFSHQRGNETLGLTLDLVNDPSEPPLYLPTFQPILPPDEDEVEKQEEEERRGVHQFHPVAGGKR